MTLQMTTAGESHGPALTVILDGIPAGLSLDEAMIRNDLERRQRGAGSGERMKIESDYARIMGGVMEGHSTGAPISLLIENRDHPNWLGKAVASFTRPRPGHADLAGVLKYGGNDLRPILERTSARETAARVAAGAVCRQLLAQFNIQVGGYVFSLGGVHAQLDGLTWEERFEGARNDAVQCPDGTASLAMAAEVQKAQENGDTLGGVIEVAVLGLPPGLGSQAQWNRRLEARLGAAILSVPAIKGVEIGPAFENSTLPGTCAQDPILLKGETIQRNGQRSGGLEGGITTGQPLWVRAAMKPIATTRSPQKTVDLASGESCETHYERSDTCPVPRAVVVVEAMVAFVLADALLEKTGGDSLEEIMPRFASLRSGQMQDFHLTGEPHVFWPRER